MIASESTTEITEKETTEVMMADDPSDAMETQALELVRQADWQAAVQLFDQLLEKTPATTNDSATTSADHPKDRTIELLIGRTECLLELNQYEKLIVDCKSLLNLLNDPDQNTAAGTRRRLIHGLYKLKRYTEAEEACREWSQLTTGKGKPMFMFKILERYRTVIQIANGQKSNQRISLQRLDEEMLSLDAKLDSWITQKSADAGVTKGTPENALSPENNFHKQIEQITLNNGDSDGDGSNICCTYCALTFADRTELRAHCQTEQHQNVIMSDEGRDWKWRPPPRGYSADSYNLCESFSDNGLCHYANQCAEAHGVDELNEWKERLEYRKMRVKRACEKELYGKSYTEQLLEKWVSAPSPDRIMTERMDGVDESVSNELVTTVSSKVSQRDWTFTLKTKRILHAVALLQDAHRNHFVLKQVIPGESEVSKQNTANNSVVEEELCSDQEWVSSEVEKESSDTIEHLVKVVFSTDIYGTFRQTVVFDFGDEPVLVKHICVDVIPVSDADKIQEIRNEMVLSTAERWNSDNARICLYTTPPIAHLATPAYIADEVREKDLLERYPCPRASTFTLTQSTITEKKLTKNNYRSRIHELLYVEEIARYEQVARYNLRTPIRVTTNYLLTPSGMATSTAKYSHSGELFAIMTLGKDVSEDTSAGRLILNNCTSVYIAKAGDKSTKTENRKVYEAMIEDKGKTMIYLRLSAQSVKDLGMIAETDFEADIQFQLNRLSYCEWHHALDKIADFRLIFPETYIEPNIEWSPLKHWDETLDHTLNSKQKEAVLAITTPTNVPLPPILLIGPFGTGKTFTLASSIKQVLLQPESRILICTHSNSAADLYIKDYLHPWVEEGMEEAKPLRVYYHKRWVATVNTIVQKYCLIDLNINVRNFRRPSKEDIMKYRIVVVTLSISMELASLGLPKGHFTHIFLDEAAQAMECEAIMPLALAGETTRIVLAGDHMQMSPELFSNFAKERKLHISLLERLYDHYPADFPCKILLCENYRAHEAITKFTSELFYDQKLIASGKQPRHEKFYPLTFFTTRGEDVQDKNSTAFYNNSEVYEVVERVSELRKKWPTTWGKLNEQSIGIMTPYADQVFRIRSELRKRRMGGISVERVLNVQGKQFRAIFLSTVRTRRTCTGAGQSDDMDYGFLSNSKLLNTAITRAQSLVAVVGDPVALCSIGRCRKVWERFIEICNQNKSLFGITGSLLRSQLDGVELKKTYVLNPLAPEFVPRALQAESYLRDQQVAIQHSTNLHHSTPHQMSHQPPQIQSHLQHQPLQPTPQLQHPHLPHPMAHAQPPPHGHHHGSHPTMPPHHMNHTNFQSPNLMGPQMRNNAPGPLMPPFGGGPPGQPPMHPNTSSQYPPYVFYPNQQQQPGGGPHGPPQQQQPPPIIRPPHMQPPPQQQPQNFLPANQPNLWGPSPQFTNTPNAWPKLGSGPHPIRPQQQQQQPPPSVQMSQGPPLNMPQSVRQQQQQQQQLRSPVSQQPQHMHHSQQQQQQPMAYMQGNKPPQLQQPTGPPQLMGQHQAGPSTFMSSVQQQQNTMRMGPGPVSPANIMHPTMQQQQHDQHMSPLTSEVMASIAARASQVAAQGYLSANGGVGPKAQQRSSGGSGSGMMADHFPGMEKDLQFMHNITACGGIVGGMGGHQGPPMQPAGVATLPLNMSGDFSSILPPNMSFYEMALEPKEFQFKWFVKLVESQGLEAANKFTEILRQVPTSLANISAGQSSGKMHRNDSTLAHHAGGGSFGAGDMGYDVLLNDHMGKDPPQMHQHHQLPMQHHNPMQQIHQHHSMPHHQQQQQHSQQQLHQPHHQGSSSGHIQQQQQQQQIGGGMPSHHVSTVGPRTVALLNDCVGGAGNNSPPSLAAQSTSAMQSVPLYRRQAGAMNFGAASTGNVGMGSDLLNDPNLFDNLMFNQNDGTFQGLPPIQSLTAGLQQQQSGSYVNTIHGNAPSMMMQQQHMQSHRSGLGVQGPGPSGMGGGDDLLGRNASDSGTTYASVLSQGSNTKAPMNADDKDPFSAIRELGQRTNGLYNYFQ